MHPFVLSVINTPRRQLDKSELRVLHSLVAIEAEDKQLLQASELNLAAKRIMGDKLPIGLLVTISVLEQHAQLQHRFRLASVLWIASLGRSLKHSKHLARFLMFLSNDHPIALTELIALFDKGVPTQAAIEQLFLFDSDLRIPGLAN